MNNCIQCGKKIISIKSISKGKFCCKNCRDKFCIYKYRKEHHEEWLSKLREYTNRPYVKEKKSAFFKEWYSKNKERQYENIYRYIKLHKNKVYTYHYVNKFRKEVIEIIGNKCILCSLPLEEIHHKKYFYFHVKNKELTPETKDKIKKYLIPYCRQCHRRLHRKD